MRLPKVGETWAQRLPDPWGMMPVTIKEVNQGYLRYTYSNGLLYSDIIDNFIKYYQILPESAFKADLEDL